MVMGSAAETQEEPVTDHPSQRVARKLTNICATRCAALYHGSILQKVVAEVPSASSTNSL